MPPRHQNCLWKQLSKIWYTALWNIVKSHKDVRTYKSDGFSCEIVTAQIVNCTAPYSTNSGFEIKILISWYTLKFHQKSLKSSFLKNFEDDSFWNMSTKFQVAENLLSAPFEEDGLTDRPSSLTFHHTTSRRHSAVIFIWRFRSLWHSLVFRSAS